MISLKKYITDCPDHRDYLETIGIEKLIELRVDPGYGWKRGLKRK